MRGLRRRWWALDPTSKPDLEAFALELEPWVTPSKYLDPADSDARLKELEDAFACQPPQPTSEELSSDIAKAVADYVFVLDEIKRSEGSAKLAAWNDGEDKRMRLDDVMFRLRLMVARAGR